MDSNSVVQQLIDMGFAENRARRAVQACNNQGMEAALEWLLAQNEELDREEAAAMDFSSATADNQPQNQQGNANATKPDDESMKVDPEKETNQEAKGLKCLDCGKIFSDTDAAALHSYRTQHENFEETMEEKGQLTEEEKEKQKQILQERLRQLRQEKAEKERKEKIEKEKERRDVGKKNLVAKQKMNEDALKKMAEERKAEKEEDKRIRKQILENIRQDREAKKVGHGAPPPQPSIPAAPAQTSNVPPGTETRIQVRLLDGSTFVHNFSVEDTLGKVKEFIVQQARQDESKVPSSFHFLVTFPKKVFTEEDLQKTLKDLNLLPSATLVVTKN